MSQLFGWHKNLETFHNSQGTFVSTRFKELQEQIPKSVATYFSQKAKM